MSNHFYQSIQLPYSLQFYQYANEKIKIFSYFEICQVFKTEGGEEGAI